MRRGDSQGVDVRSGLLQIDRERHHHHLHEHRAGERDASTIRSASRPFPSALLRSSNGGNLSIIDRLAKLSIT